MMNKIKVFQLFYFGLYFIFSCQPIHKPGDTGRLIAYDPFKYKPADEVEVSNVRGMLKAGSEFKLSLGIIENEYNQTSTSATNRVAYRFGMPLRNGSRIRDIELDSKALNMIQHVIASRVQGSSFLVSEPDTDWVIYILDKKNEKMGPARAFRLSKTDFLESHWYCEPSGVNVIYYVPGLSSAIERCLQGD